MPDDTFKKIWNFIMILLLAYVASWVPFSICFDNSRPGDPITITEYVDTMVDGFFLIDIFVNFISSYEDPDTTLPIVSLKKISIHYLTGWFPLDLIAVIPM